MIFHLLLDCIIKDDDDCLRSAKKPIKHKSDYDYEYMKKWNMLKTCESEKSYCKNNSAYTKDLQRCCPVTCKTGALTEIECLALEGGGMCIYPNEAQCYKNGKEKRHGFDAYIYLY